MTQCSGGGSEAPPAPIQPFDAVLDVINRRIARLLGELADGVGAVAGAADDDDRLVRLGKGFDLLQPASGIVTALVRRRK